MSLRNSLDETNSNKHAKALSDDESNIKKRKSFDTFLTRKKSTSKKSAPSSPHKKSHSSYLDSIKDEEDKEFRSPEEEKKYLADLQAQFNAAKEEILAIKKERYPQAVASFIKFLRAFHSASTSHQGDLLNDSETVEKVTDEMISKFFKKHTFRSDLAAVFVTEGIKESDLKHFATILLHTNVQKRLQEKNKDIQLTAASIQTLCENIRNNPQYANKPLSKHQEKQPEKQRDKMRISAVLKSHSRKNSLETESSSQPEQPLNASSLSAAIEAIIEETEPPLIAPRKTTLSSSSSSVQTLRPIFIFSAATKRNDEKIDVVLKNVEEHIARLDKQAKEDLSKKDVYYAVNNLYNRCRTRIIEQQSDKNRIFKDPKHKLISESNEVRLLQRVDDLLTTVYNTPFDYDSASPDQLKDHINKKHEAWAKYKRVCNQSTLGATLGKVALAVAIAVGVTLACVALGTCIGALVFAWTGPGAFITAVKGGLLGGSIGWTVGLLTASAATGISASVITSKFWLFKDSKLQQGINKVAEEASNVIKREEILKAAP